MKDDGPGMSVGRKTTVSLLDQHSELKKQAEGAFLPVLVLKLADINML